MAPDGASPRGAYGLRFEGLAGADALLVPVATGQPRLGIKVRQGRVVDRTEHIDPQSAELALLDGGWVSLTRAGVARFTMPDPVSPEEIVHPWVVPAAATLNGWLGRQVLHGGVLACGGLALAVLGDREAGKSSLLAWASRDPRMEVLADDLVVVQDGTVYAGPRCIDLRPGGAAAVAPEAEDNLVRGATRLRLRLAPCAPSAQLAGIVVLAWGEADDAIELRELGAGAAVAALMPHALGHTAIGAGATLLDLLSHPVLTLTRPRRWACMPAAVDRLAGLLAAPATTLGR